MQTGSVERSKESATGLRRRVMRVAALAGALAWLFLAATPADAGPAGPAAPQPMGLTKTPMGLTSAPMDLANAEPRRVAVRFEVSPAEHPGRTDAVYTPSLAAWLEPEEGVARLRVTIPGPTVEAHLVAGHEPVPGSFSDFVWSFDPATGHVHSATVHGSVVRTLDWGLVRTRARARLRFRMDTLRTAGFRTPRRVLGQPVSYFCEPDARDDCVRVEARRYDATTGYVNAVGPIEVENAVLGMRTFSTLGEAVFSEWVASAAPGFESPAKVAPAPQHADLGMPAVPHAR